jgi:hypothetical protein
LRNSPHGLWAAPLAIVLARLLLDPLLLSYYVAALKGRSSSARRSPRRCC